MKIKKGAMKRTFHSTFAFLDVKCSIFLVELSILFFEMKFWKIWNVSFMN